MYLVLMKYTPKTYLPIISSLRGLAATAICFYHFVWSTVDYIKNEWVRTIFYYAQYGVPLFFVISAIVLPLSMFKHNYQFSHLKTFMLKRLIRLEPPYFVSLILATIYLIFQSCRHNEISGLNLDNFLLHLGYLIPFVEGQDWINPIYWSLAVEFQYYIFLSIAFLALRHSQITWRLLAYSIMLAACHLSDNKAFLFRWLPLFLMGILYVTHRQKVIQVFEYFIVSLLSLIGVYYLLGIENALVAVFTLLLVHFFPHYNPRITNWIGKLSYSLYLLHLTIGQPLVNFLSHHYRLPYQKVVVLLTGYLISLFAAWLLHKYVEKPSQFTAANLDYKQ